MRTIAINWANCMNHIFGRQFVTESDLSLSGFATIQLPAFREQFATRRPMNGSINTSAAKQRGISRVDDSVYGQLDNIALNGSKYCHGGSSIDASSLQYEFGFQLIQARLQAHGVFVGIQEAFDAIVKAGQLAQSSLA